MNLKEIRERLNWSNTFGFIDTFFSFHYCNVCKWLNRVFVQQFSDLYLSEVMGGQKGSTFEAQAPRDPYFTTEAFAITCTITHRHRNVHLLLGMIEWSGVELCIQEYWCSTVARWGLWENGLKPDECLDMSNTSPCAAFNNLTQHSDIQRNLLFTLNVGVKNLYFFL